MSFTAEVKDELSRLMPEHLAPRKAELSALIHLQGKVFPGPRLELSSETASVVRIIYRLLHETYQLKTEITTPHNSLHHARCYLITVPAQVALQAALTDLHILSAAGISMEIDPRLLDRSETLAAYLRGAFLASGFISSPQKDFHFELSCANPELANGLTALLLSIGMPARLLKRRNYWVVYLKGIEPITDFLALTGAHRSRLMVENVLVTKSLKNDINRRLNAEMANQTKSIDASLEQVKAIRYLAEQSGLESLPPALRELAALRLKHPEASLKELGELARPALTKSAVYHRVRRIEAIARDYLTEKVSLSAAENRSQEARIKK
jgi:DNA-binding protein WhiA